MPESTRMFQGLSHLDRAIDAVYLELWGSAISFGYTQTHGLKLGEIVKILSIASKLWIRGIICFGTYGLQCISKMLLLG